MRRATVLLTLVAALVAVALAFALGAPWAFSSGSASATASLVCSVKPSCGAGEVAVFRMSSTSNAHAGTPSGSSYGNVVCCGGVAGLGTACSGVYDTVLRLSAADNAHVASDGSYGTQVCLSAGTADAVDCRYGTGCPADYACLATISGTTNAHVADCDGVDDYATKVCCYAGPPIAVGGMVEMQVDGSEAPASATEGSRSSGPPYAAIAGGLAAVALLALTAGGWYARRRRLG